MQQSPLLLVTRAIPLLESAQEFQPIINTGRRGMEYAN
jgi:hypothetical protein